jgi:hypothetical protein
MILVLLAEMVTKERPYKYYEKEINAIDSKVT